jgi:hypothetical protein
MQNQSFQNSLRCLQNPITWLSIALLLINDHVLKNISPSWLTGKLSDFAGIFFFPFIIAAGLSIFLVKLNLTTRQIGQIAFGFVVVWFVLLKTFQPVNYLTARVASNFIGFPTKFSLDPTDLISLFMLIPAWIIWEQVNFKKPTRIGYAMLLLGSLAAIATSPPYFGITKVTNLEYYKDGIVYAADREVTDSENYYPVAKSLDGGITWEEAPEVSNIEERGLPIKHCSHLYPEICYKLTKSGKLQELSSDGTWIDVKGLEIELNPYETKKIKVYDLILFEWEEKEYTIIAIGEYGIWRRELPNGDWSEISVLYADE